MQLIVRSSFADALQTDWLPPNESNPMHLSNAENKIRESAPKVSGLEKYA